MRKVLIATPCYDGKLSVWYVNSLMNSIYIAGKSGIVLAPVWMSYDALVQRSRNDLVELFMQGNFSDMIWIDSDVEWNPEWIIKLLISDKDVVGGTYRKKTDEIEDYTVKTESLEIEDGLIEVEGLGFGFIKTSRKAIEALYHDSEPYESGGKNARNVFEVIIKDGTMVGEDILVCQKLKELGFSIYLDPSMTCNHDGNKLYAGNFMQFMERLKK